MATTDLDAILAAWKTELDASPLSLVPAIAPFTFDAQPAGMIDLSYYLDDGGQVSRQSVTNDTEVRRDRVRLWIAKPMEFAGPTQLRALHTLVDDCYRHLVELARDNGYNVETDGRQIAPARDGVYLVARVDLTVDYDFRASIS